jgi:hypothetical protein
MHALATEHDSVTDLQAELQARGIAVEVDGADLKVRGRTGALTPELRTAIQAHKPALMLALTGFTALDRAIIRSTAAKHTLTEIQDRLAHARAMAAQRPDSLLWQHVVWDWTAILRAKEQGHTRMELIDAPAADPSPPVDHDTPASAGA